MVIHMHISSGGWGMRTNFVGRVDRHVHGVRRRRLAHGTHISSGGCGMQHGHAHIISSGTVAGTGPTFRQAGVVGRKLSSEGGSIDFR